MANVEFFDSGCTYYLIERPDEEGFESWDSLVGSPLVFTGEECFSSNKTQFLGRRDWFEFKQNSSGQTYRAGIGPGWNWSTDPPRPPQPTQPKCECPIMAGCSCGVFEAEMSAKGKAYDPFLRMWVKQH